MDLEANLQKLLEKSKNTRDYIPSFPKRKFDTISLVEKMEYYEKNSTIRIQEIRLLVKYYLETTSETPLSITSNDNIESQRLIKKYGVEKMALFDNVTLHRIAVTYPIIVVEILREYKIERKFSTSMLSKMNADKFPWSMRTQTCLGLMPIVLKHTVDDSFRNILFAIIVFMYYENKVINANKKPMEIFETVLDIALKTCNNRSISAQEKKDALTHVVLDYIENETSVDNLLKFFRSEIPEAEPAFHRRFRFINDI